MLNLNSRTVSKNYLNQREITIIYILKKSLNNNRLLKGF